jgi:hypothetical protein
MSRTEGSRRTGVATASSRHNPTVVNAGAVLAESDVGLALCTATQTRQEADAVWFGWICVDSAATVHKSRNRHSHVDRRIQTRIGFPASELDA